MRSIFVYRDKGVVYRDKGVVYRDKALFFNPFGNCSMLGGDLDRPPPPNPTTLLID